MHEQPTPVVAEQIKPGVMFTTKHEPTECTVSTVPDVLGNFDAYDSDGVLCTFSLQMVERITYTPGQPYDDHRERLILAARRARVEAKGACPECGEPHSDPAHCLRANEECPCLEAQPVCIGGDCRPEWNWRRTDCPVHGGYGLLATEEGIYAGARSVLKKIEASAAGNVVLVIAIDAPGWHQTEHVVLTRDEARELLDDLAYVVNETPRKRLPGA